MFKDWSELIRWCDSEPPVEATDKTTKDIVLFETMLQVAKNYEQCEKAKAMQQAKGPREQTNYRDTKTPPKSEHRRVKVNLTVSVRLTSFSIVQVQHTLAPCSPPPPLKQAVL